MSARDGNEPRVSVRVRADMRDFEGDSTRAIDDMRRQVQDAFGRDISPAVVREITASIVQSVREAGAIVGGGAPGGVGGSTSTQPSAFGGAPPPASTSTQPSPSGGWSPAPVYPAGPSPSEQRSAMARLREEIGGERRWESDVRAFAPALMPTSSQGLVSGVIGAGRHFASSNYNDDIEYRKNEIARTGVDPGAGSSPGMGGIAGIATAALRSPAFAVAAAAVAPIAIGMGADNDAQVQRANLTKSADLLGTTSSHWSRGGMVANGKMSWDMMQWAIDNGFSPDQAMAAWSEYGQGVGFHDKTGKPSDMLMFSRAGVNVGTTARFDRLRAPGIDATGAGSETLTELVTQATVYEGLRTKEVDERINRFAGIVERLAQKGVKVDASTLAEEITRSASAPGFDALGVNRMGLTEAAANAAMASMDDSRAPFRNIWKHAVTVEAARRGGSFLDQERSKEKIASSTEESAMALLNGNYGHINEVMALVTGVPGLSIDDAEKAINAARENIRRGEGVFGPVDESLGPRTPETMRNDPFQVMKRVASGDLSPSSVVNRQAFGTAYHAGDPQNFAMRKEVEGGLKRTLMSVADIFSSAGRSVLTVLNGLGGEEAGASLPENY